MHESIFDIANKVQRAGGKAYIIGGYVRDRVLELESKDYDIEVFGLELPKLKSLLTRLYGANSVNECGAAFGVLKIKHQGVDIDVSVPRTESKTGDKHTDFDVSMSPNIQLTQALRRRDFTMNSMALDPLTGHIEDPFYGRYHLKSRTLEVTDPATFGDDPLRALRAMQFISRFNLRPTWLTLNRCYIQDLTHISKERLYEEFCKMLLKGTAVSKGLQFLQDSSLWLQFPEIKALYGVKQSPDWHAEGDVFTHTCMVVDEASKFRTGDVTHDLILMFSALCHDMGKPGVTKEDANGKVTSYQHEDNLEPVESFLTSLRAPNWLIDKVKVLVKYHLTPVQYVVGSAGNKAYRRLKRELDAADLLPSQLLELVVADQMGRIPVRINLMDQLADFSAKYQKAHVNELGVDTIKPIVNGHDVMTVCGIKPGPKVGYLLAKAVDLQDEGFSREEILDLLKLEV